MSDTYTAWDNNQYPSPPPADWYQAPDGLWWPEGYGPGPAAAEPEVAPAPAPPVQAPPARPTPAVDSYSPPVSEPGVGFAPPPGAPAPDLNPPTLDLGPAPGSAEANPEPAQKSSRPNTGLLVALGLLVAAVLVGVPLALYLASSSDDDEADATTETTAAPADNPDLPLPGTGPGSLNQAWKIGDPVAVFYDNTDTGTNGRWTVRVSEPVADATSSIVGVNEFNEAPAAGYVYALIPVEVTFKTGSADAVITDLSFNALGASGELFTVRSSYCGVVPNELSMSAGIAPGDRIVGNLCWAVPASDVASLKLVIQAEGVAGAVYVDLN